MISLNGEVRRRDRGGEAKQCKVLALLKSPPLLIYWAKNSQGKVLIETTRRNCQRFGNEQKRSLDALMVTCWALSIVSLMRKQCYDPMKEWRNRRRGRSRYNTYCWVRLSWGMWFRPVSQQTALDRGELLYLHLHSPAHRKLPIRGKMGRWDPISPKSRRNRGWQCLGLCLRKSLMQDASREWKKAPPLTHSRSRHAHV